MAGKSIKHGNGRGYTIEELQHLRAINEVKQSLLTEHLKEAYKGALVNTITTANTGAIGRVNNIIENGIAIASTGIQTFRNIKQLVAIFKSVKGN